MKRTNRGFTLVELLMVVLIISLLIFILIPAVTGVVKQVDIHQTQMLVNLLDLGCQQYKSVFGSYPPTEFEYGGYANPGGNLDGWTWGTQSTYSCGAEPGTPIQSIFILTYCLQGPAGMGWKMNRDGKRSNNPSASVTADFGPWIEAGNQNIQPNPSVFHPVARYRPAFMDSFGQPICYLAARLGKTRPNLSSPILLNLAYNPAWGATEYQGDRYYGAQAMGFWNSQSDITYPGTTCVVNSLGIQNLPNMNELYAMFLYAAMMSQTYNPSTGWSGVPMTGKCYNANTFVIWSAGPDQMFGFWYYDDTWNGYVLDLTFNPANFDDITNFR